MLKLKYLIENFDLAAYALKNWEHDSKRLNESLQWFRSSANAIYPFFAGEKLCYLRLAPTEEKLESNLTGELEFLLWLREKGFPAMKPLKTKDGSYLLTLNTQWGEYFACAFEGVSGVQIEETDCSDDIMKEYGRTLARLHQLSGEFMPKVRKWSYTDAFSYIHEIFYGYTVPEKMKKELTKVGEALSRLPKTAENYGLVHYDFELDNVFYDEQTKSCNVIDFDDGMYHWYALDIEQVLDAVEEDCEGDTERAKEMFLCGYREVKKFDDEDSKLLPLMRRFCNLYSYARLVRCMDEKLVDEPEWMLFLREKLKNKMQRIESGIQDAV